jgi:hypothetical protein
VLEQGDPTGTERGAAADLPGGPVRLAPSARAKRWYAWTAVAVGLVLVSIGFVIWAGMRPGYDAYGWLVWGRQTLHGHLDTNGAPSWKPLTFLFTLPYSLIGRGSQWLWMVTSVAAGLSGSVFAARIAYRLTGAAPERRYAAVVAAAFAGVGVLAIDGYWQLVLQANSDPMIISLCLAAIDCQLSGRPRLAFGALVLAALGRPEAWPFVAIYALWGWWAIRSMRLLIAAGVVIVPALWFTVPALTSRSWLTPGDLALNSAHVLNGSKVFGVIGRFLRLNELPMLLAALLAVVLAVARRDRDVLLVTGAACLWVAIEIGFALHGWSAVPRYLAEPAAVVVVLAGTAVGQILAASPQSVTVVRWLGPAAVVILVVSLLPTVHRRAGSLHTQVVTERTDRTKITRLRGVIARIGGDASIRACGQPVGDVGYQSILAWDLGVNVGEVGYKPGRAINQRRPIVLFKRHNLGWSVRPIHTLPANRATCDRLRTDTTFN